MRKKNEYSPVDIFNHLYPSSRYLLETTNESPARVAKIRLLSCDDVVIKFCDIVSLAEKAGFVPSESEDKA